MARIISFLFIDLLPSTLVERFEPRIWRFSNAASVRTTLEKNRYVGSIILGLVSTDIDVMPGLLHPDVHLSFDL
jgi:hypothetical protein